MAICRNHAAFPTATGRLDAPFAVALLSHPSSLSLSLQLVPCSQCRSCPPPAIPLHPYALDRQIGHRGQGIGIVRVVVQDRWGLHFPNACDHAIRAVVVSVCRWRTDWGRSLGWAGCGSAIRTVEASTGCRGTRRLRSSAPGLRTAAPPPLPHLPPLLPSSCKIYWTTAPAPHTPAWLNYISYHTPPRVSNSGQWAINNWLKGDSHECLATNEIVSFLVLLATALLLQEGQFVLLHHTRSEVFSLGHYWWCHINQVIFLQFEVVQLGIGLLGCIRLLWERILLRFNLKGWCGAIVNGIESMINWRCCTLLVTAWSCTVFLFCLRTSFTLMVFFKFLQFWWQFLLDTGRLRLCFFSIEDRNGSSSHSRHTKHLSGSHTDIIFGVILTEIGVVELPHVHFLEL